MCDDQSMSKIISRIKNRRSELGMSYQDLADKTGMSKSTLQRYETGAIKNMPIDKLGIIAKAMDISPAYLMGWDEEPADEIKPNKKDIEKALNATLEQLENEEGLMLSGNPIDETDWEFIKNAIRNGLEYSKKVNKEKYTPKKYKK